MKIHFKNMKGLISGLIIFSFIFSPSLQAAQYWDYNWDSTPPYGSWGRTTIFTHDGYLYLSVRNSYIPSNTGSTELPNTLLRTSNGKNWDLVDLPILNPQDSIEIQKSAVIVKFIEHKGALYGLAQDFRNNSNPVRGKRYIYRMNPGMPWEIIQDAIYDGDGGWMDAISYGDYLWAGDRMGNLFRTAGDNTSSPWEKYAFSDPSYPTKFYQYNEIALAEFAGGLVLFSNRTPISDNSKWSYLYQLNDLDAWNSELGWSLKTSISPILGNKLIYKDEINNRDELVVGTENGVWRIYEDVDYWGAYGNFSGSGLVPFRLEEELFMMDSSRRIYPLWGGTPEYDPGLNGGCQAGESFWGSFTKLNGTTYALACNLMSYKPGLKSVDMGEISERNLIAGEYSTFMSLNLQVNSRDVINKFRLVMVSENLQNSDIDELRILTQGKKFSDFILKPDPSYNFNLPPWLGSEYRVHSWVSPDNLKIEIIRDSVFYATIRLNPKANVGTKFITYLPQDGIEVESDPGFRLAYDLNSNQYSNIVPNANTFPEATDLIVAPNPASQNTNFYFPFENGGSAEVRIFDKSGVQIKLLNGPKRIFGGITGTLSWPVKDIAPGVYLAVLKVSNPGQKDQIYKSKVVVER